MQAAQSLSKTMLQSQEGLKERGMEGAVQPGYTGVQGEHPGDTRKQHNGRGQVECMS